jgi:hypothetical protein
MKILKRALANCPQRLVGVATDTAMVGISSVQGEEDVKGISRCSVPMAGSIPPEAMGDSNRALGNGTSSFGHRAWPFMNVNYRPCSLKPR